MSSKELLSVKLYYPSGETLTASANKAINVLYTLLTAHYDNIVSAPHRLDGLHRDKAARRYWRCGLRCCIFSFTQYIKQKLGAQIIQQVSWFPGWNGELIKKEASAAFYFRWSEKRAVFMFEHSRILWGKTIIPLVIALIACHCLRQISLHFNLDFQNGQYVFRSLLQTLEAQDSLLAYQLIWHKPFYFSLRKKYPKNDLKKWNAEAFFINKSFCITTLFSFYCLIWHIKVM